MTELEAKAKDCIENHTHKLVDKPTKQDIYLREESIFISGYKLGATENGIQWHDLRKDPNDLPPMINDERKISNNVWLHIHNWGTEEAYYDYRKCSWIVRCRIVDLDVIAWCEIPTFKE